MPYILGKHVRHKPSNGLPFDLSLEVNTLDRQEDLLQTLCSHNVQLPFRSKLGAIRYHGCWNLLTRWQVRK